MSSSINVLCFIIRFDYTVILQLESLESLGYHTALFPLILCLAIYGTITACDGRTEIDGRAHDHSICHARVASRGKK